MPTITLSDDDALVLFEFLSRFEESEQLDIVHPGERAALWHLVGAFERTLVAPFQPDYLRLVDQARDRTAQRAGLAPRPAPEQ